MFTCPHRAVHSEDSHLSSGTAAWIEIWEFKTATANTCTSAAGESVRHESESILCECVCVCSSLSLASLKTPPSGKLAFLIRALTG